MQEERSTKDQPMDTMGIAQSTGNSGSESGDGVPYTSARRSSQKSMVDIEEDFDREASDESEDELEDLVELLCPKPDYVTAWKKDQEVRDKRKVMVRNQAEVVGRSGTPNSFDGQDESHEVTDTQAPTVRNQAEPAIQADVTSQVEMPAESGDESDKQTSMVRDQEKSLTPFHLPTMTEMLAQTTAESDKQIPMVRQEEGAPVQTGACPRTLGEVLASNARRSTTQPPTANIHHSTCRYHNTLLEEALECNSVECWHVMTHPPDQTCCDYECTYCEKCPCGNRRCNRRTCRSRYLELPICGNASCGNERHEGCRWPGLKTSFDDTVIVELERRRKLDGLWYDNMGKSSTGHVVQCQLKYCKGKCEGQSQHGEETVNIPQGSSQNSGGQDDEDMPQSSDDEPIFVLETEEVPDVPQESASRSKGKKRKTPSKPRPKTSKPAKKRKATKPSVSKAPTSVVKKGRANKITSLSTAIERRQIDDTMLLGIYRLPSKRVIVMTAGIERPSWDAAKPYADNYDAALDIAVERTLAHHPGEKWHQLMVEKIYRRRNIKPMAPGESTSMNIQDMPVVVEHYREYLVKLRDLCIEREELPADAKENPDQENDFDYADYNVPEDLVEPDIALTEPQEGDFVTESTEAQSLRAIMESATHQVDPTTPRKKETEAERRKRIPPVPRGDPRYMNEFRNIPAIYEYLKGSKPKYDRHQEYPAYFDYRGHLYKKSKVPARAKEIHSDIFRYHEATKEDPEVKSLSDEAFNTNFQKPKDLRLNLNAPGVFNTKGQVRQRRPKATQDLHNPDGTFRRVVENETRKLAPHTQDAIFIAALTGQEVDKVKDKKERTDVVRNGIRSAQLNIIEQRIAMNRQTEATVQYVRAVMAREKSSHQYSVDMFAKNIQLKQELSAARVYIRQLEDQLGVQHTAQAGIDTSDMPEEPQLDPQLQNQAVALLQSAQSLQSNDSGQYVGGEQGDADGDGETPEDNAAGDDDADSTRSEPEYGPRPALEDM